MKPVMDTAEDADLLLEHQLCFALTVAARSVVGAYKPVLEKLNLTHPQYLVMLCLWETSPRTVRNISEALVLEPATISPLLRRLETAGLITRQRADGNERALAVGLTPAGAALRKEALAVPGAMMERLGLTRDQVSELHSSMMGLIAATTPGRIRNLLLPPGTGMGDQREPGAAARMKWMKEAPADA